MISKDDYNLLSSSYDDTVYDDIRGNSDLLMLDYIYPERNDSKKIVYNGVEFVVSLDGKMLLSCPKNIDFFEIPESIELIADYAFSGCNKLKNVIIPEHVKGIGFQAFSDCENLTSVEILGPVEKLISTFSNCSNLKSVKLSSGLKEIDDLCRNCINLKNIELPDSLEIIGDSSFRGSGLTNIFIPKNVKRIGDSVFADCKSLISCVFDDNSELEEVGASAFENCENLSGNNAAVESRYMVNGYKISYDEETGSRSYSYFPFDKTYSVDLSAVDNLLNNIEYPFTLPDTVKFIGKNAFKSSSIVYFKIPSLVAEISDGLFSNCRKLLKVDFHDDVRRIGKEAFFHCDVLDDIKLNDNIYEIGLKAFADCDFLKNIDLPASLTMVSDELFYGCGRLTRVGLPFNLQSIGSKSFARCDDLKHISIYPSISYIADDAFLDTYLNTINYGDIRFCKKNECEINEVFSCQTREELIKNIQLVGSNKSNFKILLDLDEYSIDCSKVLSAILSFTNDKELYKNILCIFNKEEFMKNIKFFKDNNLDYLEFCNSVITYGNYGLLCCDIEKAFSNYDYLLEQNVINKELLNKIYFEGAVGSNAKELFLNYFRNNSYCKIPDLFRTLLVEDNDKNKLELRDRLVYVSTMQLLDGNYNDDKYDKALSMLKRTLFDNVVSNDKKHMSVINDDVYFEVEKYYPEMIGMMSTFYNKINGIDSTWFNQLFNEMRIKGQETKFSKFYKSLTTIKNWNQYTDDVERATLLKNEIIGRLLYADIILTTGSDSSKKDSYINKKLNLVANNRRITVGELLEYASKDRIELFKNSEAITTMLMIDPYSFDALRRGPLDNIVYKKKDLDVKSARLAIAHGYVFNDEEILRYKRVRNDNEFNLGPTLDSYVESILNSIGCAKIPEEDKETYLNNMRKQIKIYINEKSEDELFRFCRSFDLYLRNNGEYIVQGKDSSNVAKRMFDNNTKYTNDMRVMYCLYNLNKIAHNSLELNCKSAIKNKFRLATNNTVSYDRMEDIFDAYNRLYRCGIDSDLVSILLDRDCSRGITDLIFSDESSMSHTEILNKNKEIVSILNRLNISDVRNNPIVIDEANRIKNDLGLIYSMNDSEREIIGTSVLEQNTFFECKRMFSEEMINRIASEFSDDMIKAMGATIDEKREYYAKHGYVVEIQGDLGEEVLVCLCEIFNEPFSVHLKDLPDSVINALSIVPRTNTIAHCSLDGKGLSFRNDNYEKEILSISDEFNFTGFNGGRNNLKYAQRSNYDNYDSYVKRIRNVNQLDEMFDDNLEESTERSNNKK